MSIKTYFDRAFFRIPSDTGTVTLAQGRVYLLPSGRGIAVGATALVMLLVGVNYGVSLAYLAAFLIAGYLACALIAAFRNLVNLQVTFAASEDAHAGESVRFNLAIESDRERGFITFASTDAVTMIDRVRIGTNPVQLTVPVENRGQIKLGRVMVQSIAPTGLIRAFSYVHFPAHAWIYPALLRPAPPLPTANSIAANPRAEAAAIAASIVGASGDALDGVREYQPGDPLARVAWSAAARGQGWRSKRMSADSPRMLHLGWRQTSHFADPDTRLAALASWVAEAHRRGESYSLALPDGEIPAAQNSEHRTTCMRTLAMANV